LVDKIFSKLESPFQQGMPGGNITVTVKALSLVIMARDERIGERGFRIFQKIMNVVKNDDLPWELVRLSIFNTQ